MCGDSRAMLTRTDAKKPLRHRVDCVPALVPSPSEGTGAHVGQTGVGRSSTGDAREEEHQRLPKRIAAARVRLRRNLVDRVRDRRDPGRALAQAGTAPPRGTTSRHRDRRRRAADDRRHAAPADDLTPIRAAAARTSCRRENLGETPSLVAGASLLVDYILTVAVSISAGVAAIIRPPARWARLAVPICLAWCADDADQPARREGVGRDLRRPTYIYIVALTAAHRGGL